MRVEPLELPQSVPAGSGSGEGGAAGDSEGSHEQPPLAGVAGGATADGTKRPTPKQFGGTTEEFLAAFIIFHPKSEPGISSLSYLACNVSPKPKLGYFGGDQADGHANGNTNVDPDVLTIRDGVKWLERHGIAERILTEDAGEETLDNGAKVGKKGTKKHFLILRDLENWAVQGSSNATSPGGTLSDVVRLQYDHMLAPLHLNLAQYTQCYNKLINFAKFKPSQV